MLDIPVSVTLIAAAVLFVLGVLSVIVVQEVRVIRWRKAMASWERTYGSMRQDGEGHVWFDMRPDAPPAPAKRRGLPFSHIVRERKTR